MGKPRVTWNIGGFRQIRFSPGVQSAISGLVNGSLARLPEGFEGGVERGRSRVRGYVVAATPEAHRQDAEQHLLLRSLGGGG